jgi:phosphoglycerate kinase
MKSPDRPLVAVLGGAKVHDKIGVIKAFIEVADRLVISGAMANTFLAYKGVQLGKSKFDEGADDILDEIYAAARKKVGAEKVDDFLMLPTDFAVAHELNDQAQRRIVPVGNVASDEMALDIGDETIEATVADVKGAKTVIWNGTLGMAEYPNFAHGSARLALALATAPHVTSIIGGGDTADFVLHWDAKNGGSFSHVSTGGGASLELMAGDKLPGIESLLDARG